MRDTHYCFELPLRSSQKADTIVIMKDGRIDACGSYEHLLAAGKNLILCRTRRLIQVLLSLLSAVQKPVPMMYLQQYRARSSCECINRCKSL